eukprot:9491343-Pyramimonas_sp.AAC.1
MGNEFGHPEWIDFPREGNQWSHDKCRRRWDLADMGLLRYKHMLKCAAPRVEKININTININTININTLYRNKSEACVSTYEPKECSLIRLWDVGLMALEAATQFAADDHLIVSCQSEEDKVIVFERGDLCFVCNFHPSKVYKDYKVGIREPGRYKVRTEYRVRVFSQKGVGGRQRMDGGGGVHRWEGSRRTVGHASSVKRMWGELNSEFSSGNC